MKIGLIGFGFMGKAMMHSLSSINHYYKKYVPNVEVVGVATSSINSSKEIDLQRFNIRQAYENVNDLLQGDEIDSVYIASPNLVHYDQITSAIKSNKNILCDKPIAINTEQSESILNLQKPDNVYQMMFEYRNYPAIRKIKSLIDEKNIGEIINFQASYRHGSYLDPNRPMSWRLREGGGATIDLAPHLIDLCNFLVGNITFSDGFKKNVIPSRPKKLNSDVMEKVNVDDYSSCFCKTASGVTGIIHVSRLAMGSVDDLCLTIYGTKGALSWSLEDLNFYLHSKKNGIEKIFALDDFNGLADFPPPKVSNGWLRAHAHSVYQFVSMVNDIDLPPKELSFVPTFEDGHKVQSFLSSFGDYE